MTALVVYGSQRGWAQRADVLVQQRSDRRRCTTCRRDGTSVQVRRALDRVGAIEHTSLGGRLALDATGLPTRAMATPMAGDWRERESMRLLAKTIAFGAA